MPVKIHGIHFSPGLFVFIVIQVITKGMPQKKAAIQLPLVCMYVGVSNSAVCISG